MHKMAKLARVIKNVFFTLLGGLCCIFVLLFVLLSIPVYIFRFLVIQLARYYRPDLGEILNGQSSMFVNDYFGKTNPRANVVVTVVLKGHFSIDETRAVILNNWVRATDPDTGKLLYKRLQQYPVRWLGFTFWKMASESFKIENHIHLLYGNDTLVTDEQLTEDVEKLLNSPMPKYQSAWEYYLIENFKNPVNPKENHSAIIFRFHHSLTDGYGVVTSLVHGLFQADMESIKFADPVPPKRSTWEKFCFLATLPINVIGEMSYIFSHQYTGSPWKIPDEKKEWYQIVVKSENIPVKNFKDIKNAFGVGFTSVLFSVVSAAVHKSLEKRKGVKFNGFEEKSMLTMSSFPAFGFGKIRELNNHVAAALFDMPCSRFESPVKRLQELENVLQRTKRSVIPYIMQHYMTIAGAHFYPVAKLLTQNRFVGQGLTNFPGFPIDLELKGREYVNSDLLSGALDGCCGVAIAVMSHSDHLRFCISAENGMMTKEEAKEFVGFITEEVYALHELAIGKNY